MDVAENVQRARAAYAAGQWSAAREALRRQRRTTALDPDDLALLATCEWWLGDIPASVALAELAFRQQLAAGRVEAAARGALDLALICYTAGEGALGTAWYGRARRALAGHEQCVAHGYLVYIAAVSRLELDGELRVDVAAAGRAAARLSASADRLQDPALQAFADVIAGLAAVLHGHLQHGFDLLDEAMVAVVAGHLPPLWSGDIYCTVLHLCESLGDLVRMRMWTQAMESWVSPLCRTFTYYGVSRVHRLQLSSADGDWDRVEAELGARSQQLAPAHGWVAGEGFRELGDVRRLRGDTAGAETAYAAARELGIDPQPGAALLAAAGGAGGQALAQIHFALGTRRPFEGSRLLLAGVQIALACGAGQDARQFGARLSEIAARYDTPGLHARNDHARGRLALAVGRYRDAHSHLGRALEVYRAQHYRYGVAEVHELLAETLDHLGEAGAASAERATALAIYRSLGAGPDVARLAESGPVPAGLTARELEVLAAMTAGASNRQVARQLVISEKTVSRHLGNIYRKLDVTSRTAAAAWAHRHGIGD